MRTLVHDPKAVKSGDYEVFVDKATGERFQISGKTLACLPQPQTVQDPTLMSMSERLRGPRFNAKALGPRQGAPR